MAWCCCGARNLFPRPLKPYIMQEAMRIRPAVPSGNARLVARDVRLSNALVLPRGALLVP